MARAASGFFVRLIVEPPFDPPEARQCFGRNPGGFSGAQSRRHPRQSRRQRAQVNVRPAYLHRLLQEIAAPDGKLGKEHAPRKVASTDPELFAEKIKERPPGGPFG